VHPEGGDIIAPLGTLFLKLVWADDWSQTTAKSDALFPEQITRICSVCQLENPPRYHNCTRCGAAANRRIPTLLVLGTFFTREIVWGITLSGIALPLMLLLSGFRGAWLVWNGVGSTSYWGVLGFVFLMPGTFFTLAMLPMFRGI
jgi:hypothetical protein